MSTVTFQVPDELASQLRGEAALVPAILERVVREVRGEKDGFDGISDVMEALAALPSPDEVMALRPSSWLAARVEALLEKKRGEGLTAAEQQEWNRYEYLEHLVRVAKGRAEKMLAARDGRN